MNIAILLAGPYRGNATIIENHNRIIGHYHTYVSSLPHYKNDWLNSSWQLTDLFENHIEYYLNDKQKLLRRRNKKLKNINDIYRNY